jgi:hypothetical protein
MKKKFQAATNESISSAIRELGGATTAHYLSRFLQYRNQCSSDEAEVGIQRAIDGGHLRVSIRGNLTVCG